MSEHSSAAHITHEIVLIIHEQDKDEMNADIKSAQNSVTSAGCRFVLRPGNTFMAHLYTVDVYPGYLF